jgi:hypothetical protein
MMKKSILRYSFFLILVLALLSVYIPRRYGVHYPHQVGPLFDEFFKRDGLHDIATKKPQIVMVGDSVFMRGVDRKKLAEETGKTVYGIGVAGSASALWYAVLEHDIVPSPYKPEMLIIVFRDTMLTMPGYRVNGSYFKQLDEYATPDDSLIIERSYLNLMNPLEKVAEGYFPLYGSRLSLRETLDHYIRYSGGELLLGCDADCTDVAMGTVFGAGNMEQNILGDAIGTAESYLYTPQALDFNHQLDRSFLPEIVRLCNENGIQLVLIRTKTMRYPTEESEPLELKTYMNDMSTYLEANRVILLDYGQDVRLKDAFFYDPLHLNEEGRVVFTALIVDALRSLPGFNPQ